MKVLICGGRDYDDRERVRDVIMALDVENAEIVHGAARGADYLAGSIASEYNYQVTEFPADWDTHGRSAGPIRNQQMLDYLFEDPDEPRLLIAFPGGKGTIDMITKAKRAEVTCMLVQSDL